MNTPVFVFGHKNPDTDSICSAIGYSYLKNALFPQHRYQPMRLGEINRETQYVLSYFGIDVPELLTDVKTQVSDISLKYVPLVSPAISLQEAWECLKTYDTHTLPLSDDGKKIVGLITVGGIASAYMALHDPDVFHMTDTPIENLLRVLKGEVLYSSGDKMTIVGRVLVGAMHPDSMSLHINKGDLIIMGNREKSQIVAIENYAKMLILTGDAELSKKVLDKAIAYQCTILRSPMDTFTVARTIYNALPVRHFMKVLPVTYFELDDYLDEVHMTMTQKRYRNFPVYDEYHNYVGMISRIQILKPQKKQVILVDHNELAQTVEGIKEAEILEIIDHHRIGGVQTSSPVYFRNQPMGCTATIIAQHFTENQVEIPQYIAGILAAAILSDTLIFKSPTCTNIDKNVAEKLAQVAGINCEAFGREMFKSGSNLLHMTPTEIIYQDFKVFSSEGFKIGVGQVSAMEREILLSLEDRVAKEIQKVQKQQNFDMVLFMLTHISGESTCLLVAGEHEDLLEHVFMKEICDNKLELEGVVSRKKQLVPLLIQGIEERNRM